MRQNLVMRLIWSDAVSDQIHQRLTDSWLNYVHMFRLNTKIDRNVQFSEGWYFNSKQWKCGLLEIFWYQKSKLVSNRCGRKDWNIHPVSEIAIETLIRTYDQSFPCISSLTLDSVRGLTRIAQSWLFYRDIP